MRNLSLDAFRGLAILTMILVDSPPDFETLVPILKHSTWEGITIADLAFPGFVFAMGASAAFSSRRNIWRRAGILFLLGIGFNLICGQIRIFGILQRLALTYLFGILLIRWLESPRKILSASMILLAITSLGFHLYAPQDPFNANQNLSFAIDLTLIGQNYMYLGGFDPEGIFGTIPSTASMLLGFCAGILIRDKNRSLIQFGLILILLGFAWSSIDIISKPLWTSPFALLNAGFDSILLALIKFLPDKIFEALIAFGQNPLFFFLATNLILILLWKIDLYVWIWQISGLSSAMFAVIWCLIWIPLAEFFYHHRIVVKV